jgi:hypothetical protein
MKRIELLLRGAFAVMVAASVALTASPALGAHAPYTTGFARWRAADGAFANWQRDGVALGTNGTLTLDAQAAHPGVDPYAPGTYNGGNYYNGGSFYMGEAMSPPTTAPFAFTQAIASWNAATPAGTWIETQFRVQIAGRWTKWYIMGIWAADYSTIHRHSVNAQGDSDGYVATDTFVLAARTAPTSYQLKVRLFGESAGAGPTVQNMSVAVSTTPVKKPDLPPGNPALWDRQIAIPQCSQMVYPDGGDVWCSPTSTSMVLGYWDHDSLDCETRVRAAVAGVYDWIYDGHGNWPFNAAYASTHNLEAYVARFTSFAQAEPWIAAGIPVVISYAWGKKELTGAPIPSSNGHLAVLVGFDGAGNPILNDPAAPSNGTVLRTYLRSELEPLWQASSGGTVYLIYPAGQATP